MENHSETINNEDKEIKKKFLIILIKFLKFLIKIYLKMNKN